VLGIGAVVKAVVVKEYRSVFCRTVVICLSSHAVPYVGIGLDVVDVFGKLRRCAR
jgi:hypothetical protein